jgi:phosphohistidine phosphatase
MHRLVLLRHAKAERAAPSGDDFDRALTERGWSDARLMGRVLVEKGVKVDLALVSAAARTRQTWDGAAEALTGAKVEADKALYNATSTQLRAALERVDSAVGTVVMVGHNPGIHFLGVELLIAGGASGAVLERIRGRFPTASALVLDIDAAERANYAGLHLAKDHGGGGED